ncbi:hypothetical protein DAPPUDRAFT_101309 [Daphnia pulex]|uniref:C2H2-type domain-containing protein n=1 Tax=Daphnia pulex TaxID=6669 RepID=E9GCZ9_DAPPU|nr:hypothetical protein DAPPUDRAFT_101309 [Daphnia pulex]|eukprot:EFX82643.1 hypothetical protein DAPPUDRAFT_101309 [Daphnia pulex]
MERTKPTQLSPYVSNGSSTITLEMADLCAKAVVVNHDVNIKDNTTMKSNSVNQKVSSNENKPRFSCEICGHGNLLKNSLLQHKRRKHSMTSRVSGENPQVEKGFWCTYCSKKFVHAQRCEKHESVCVKKPKPSATASATMDSSSRTVQESGKLDPPISLATADAIT